MDKEKILIVDDDENIAELISLYLNKECYETQIAADGTSALEAFVEFAPNLILLDVMLPGMDGYQVCTEIRKQSNVPIIMLSAKGEVFDKVLGLKIGADDYIVKPFDSNELVARVGALLRRCNSRTDNSQNYNPTNADHIGTYVEYDNLVVNISNYTVTEKMLKHFISKATGKSIFSPRIMICIPSQVTEVEKKAVIDAATQARGKKSLFNRRTNSSSDWSRN